MTDLFSSVNINTSFQRSARIDNKISKDFLDNFVFHDTSKKVLNQISSSLLNSNQSGFTLTGPYGTGKSSLALFLKALIAKDSSIKKNDFVVITAGLPFGNAGMTNMIRLYKVGT